MAYNKDIHHRRSLRLQNFDYASASAYFITLCAYQRACDFGLITEGVMQLNKAGQIIQSVWNEIPAHFQDVEIDEFVVMPNHIHGIIVINIPAEMQFVAPKTIGEIIRTFKARCTHAINQSQSTQGTSVWQRNYYEHIIRNEIDLRAIREYIINNPLQWDLDINNPQVSNSGGVSLWDS